MEDMLEALSGDSVFSTLDLRKSYHQMKLAKDSKEITALIPHEVFSNVKYYQWE